MIGKSQATDQKLKQWKKLQKWKEQKQERKTEEGRYDNLKKTQKTVQKFRKQFRAIRKGHGGQWGCTPGQQHFWSVWTVVRRIVGCYTFMVHCIVYSKALISVLGHIHRITEFWFLCGCAAPDLLCWLPSSSASDINSRRDESDREVTGKGRSRGKNQTSLL